MNEAAARRLPCSVGKIQDRDILMFKTFRTKLLIGIATLLAIMVALGLWAVVMFSRLGNNIDVILRENYRSVLAAEGMKEALERVDSSLLFAIGGEEAQAREQLEEYQPVFDRNLKIEQNNVTLPGEQEMADALTALRTRYFDLVRKFFALEPIRKEERTRLYFSKLLPTFKDIKRQADGVLDLNQKNMEVESARARAAAALSTRLMMAGLAGAAAVATVIALLLSHAILEPIRAVTRAARAMARGDLDQVVPVVTRDELGELASAFNKMSRTIREFREAGTARLLRAQQTAQATIDSFPDPVVVLDPAGSVERANPSARRILGVWPSTPDSAAPWTPPPPLRAPLAAVLGGGPDSLPTGLDNTLCVRDDGHERFFLPRVISIRGDDGLLGAAVVLSDVTKFRLVDQLKSDMVSTVSHELKTPLTGVQMAVHLLLEEAVGPLTSKQTELLLAARQDSDRLLAMINDLLDLTRIEQGRIKLDLHALDPAALVAEAIGRFDMKAHDRGVILSHSVGSGLPAVTADEERVAHVFDNLVGNALEHTDRGGSVRVSVSAGVGVGVVRFAVEDSGEGIAPEHLPYVFDRFYRAGGSRPGKARGVGLGLAIAREIVLAHGGEIDVRSEPGRGSTFFFTLPAATYKSSDTRDD
jgi:two-component system, NtrC family, sensor histidine kinase KinB